MLWVSSDLVVGCHGYKKKKINKSIYIYICIYTYICIPYALQWTNIDLENTWFLALGKCSENGGFSWVFHVYSMLVYRRVCIYIYIYYDYIYRCTMFDQQYDSWVGMHPQKQGLGKWCINLESRKSHPLLPLAFIGPFEIRREEMWWH